MANKQHPAYKTDKLEARIAEKFGTQKAFAAAIGTSRSAICRYLKEGRDWRGSTLMKAVRLLEIPHEEIEAYFFEPRVTKTEPKRAKR